MSIFSDILYRDEDAARAERGIFGMHHAGYWTSFFIKVLKGLDSETEPKNHTADFHKTGAHFFEFRDHITGKLYEVSVKPKGE